VKQQVPVEREIIVRMHAMQKFLMLMPAFFLVCSAAIARQIWAVQTSGMQTNLRGLSVVRGPIPSSEAVVWASGSNGVVLRSDDGGASWSRLHVEGGDTLDFRGVRAIDAKTAYLMSSGEGDKSRIYKTTDGGQIWEVQYTDKRPKFFLDALVCATDTKCFALGDPIDGKFLILATDDGKTWRELPGDNMPVAIPGEGAFAASGTALALYGGTSIYFGTGGGSKARVFRSEDSGRTWTVSETPIAAGNTSSGVFSVVRVGNTVVAVGGDYREIAKSSGVAAYSVDQGATWKLASQFPGGFRSAVASLEGSTLIAAGPSGEDISQDLGKTWTRMDSLEMNAVAALDGLNAWAAGAHGQVIRYFDAGYSGHSGK